MSDKQVQLEYLNRGLIAVKTDEGILVRWRITIDEFTETYYELYRDGELISTITKEENSNYLDTDGTLDSKYYVKSYNGDQEHTSETVEVLENPFFDIPMDKPEGGVTPDGIEYSYTANDLSVGDVGTVKFFMKTKN